MHKPFEDTYTYGNQPQFEVESLTIAPLAGWTEDGIIRSEVSIPRSTIDAASYLQALDDINSSFKIVEDAESGKSFELAIVEGWAKHLVNDQVDLEISTYSSSISGNVGNAIEFAEHSALHPQSRRIYVASFGNGGSSYWDKKEQKYISETGRFVQPNGTPLPTVAALARVLEREDIVVGRLSTNSAGGAHATSLMAALPEGQVSHAFLKSRPNISNHQFGIFWGLGDMVVGQELFDKRNYANNTQDPWKMTTELQDEARKILDKIYADGSGNWSPANAVKTSGISKLWTDMTAFSRGGEAHGHPAAKDTAVALKVQPEAEITYHFPLKDRLYNNVRKDVVTFLGALARATNPEEYSRVEALLIPGTHHDHSAYPSLRWSVEDYAFAK